MDRSDRTLYHQVHPAKLGTDLLSEFISIPLLWKHQLVAGLVSHLVPPMITSAIVSRRTPDLERIKASRAGRYIAAEMTPPMVGLRVAGDVVAMVGAWRRQPLVIVFGALLVGAGWTLGPRPDPSHPPAPPTLR